MEFWQRKMKWKQTNLFLTIMTITLGTPPCSTISKSESMDTQWSTLSDCQFLAFVIIRRYDQVGWRLQNTLTASLQRGKTSPMSALNMNLNNLMVRFQCWSFGGMQSINSISHKIRFHIKSFYSEGACTNWDCFFITKKLLILFAFPFWGTSYAKQ